MPIFESAFKKLHKDEIMNLALVYQSKFDTSLAGIKNELSHLKKDFKQLRSNLSITKLVNTKLKALSDKHGAMINTLGGSA